MISFQTWKPCLFESLFQIKVLKPFLFIPLEDIVRFIFEPRKDVHLPLQRNQMVVKQEKLSKIKKSALTLSLHLEVFCFFTLLCFCCLKTWRCERFAGHFSLEIMFLRSSIFYNIPPCVFIPSMKCRDKKRKKKKRHLKTW